MAECECLPQCPFFNDKMADKPAIAGLMKKQYCLDKFENCARYMVFKALGREAVPANMFPNQKDRAVELLNSK